MLKIPLITGCILLAVSCNTAPVKNEGKAIDSTVTATTVSNVKMDQELPARSSLPGLFDEMDEQQAAQTYLWGLPIVAYAEWQRILLRGWFGYPILGCREASWIVDIGKRCQGKWLYQNSKP